MMAQEMRGVLCTMNGDIFPRDGMTEAMIRDMLDVMRVDGLTVKPSKDGKGIHVVFVGEQEQFDRLCLSFSKNIAKYLKGEAALNISIGEKTGTFRIPQKIKTVARP